MTYILDKIFFNYIWGKKILNMENQRDFIIQEDGIIFTIVRKKEMLFVIALMLRISILIY